VADRTLDPEEVPVSRKIISCPACNARFDVAKYPPGSRVRCGRCSQVLTVPTATGPLSEAAAVTPPPPARPAAPPAKSRSVSRADVSAAASKAAARAAPATKPTKRGQDAGSLTNNTAKPPETAPVASSLGTPGPEGRDPLLGRVVNGQFKIVRKLGEGGYGAVYEAKDVNLERRIALKVMLPSRAASREYVAKFFREARTAAQLSHPNVVAVHGVGLDKDNNIYFLAMEFVEGRTLHDVLQERGPMPVEDAVNFIEQACRGLAAAHERNIIHRDIKPGNLMITPSGAIKIADFGLAKVYEGETAQSTVIGTPYFMPPEQFEGKAKDGRTDIYALGVTFYYMLTLQRAHTGAGPAQILLSVMTKEPTSVLEHRPELPEGIWPIVRRMIDRDLDRRYSNCLDIIRDLEQLTGGGVVDAEQIYCPACGAGNAVDATACSGCKISLLEICPVCGGEDAAGTKFCGNCGANIPAERAVAALVEEARQFLAVGRLGRAREKLQQAQERSPENIGVADAMKELDAKREQRDAHRDAIRELLSRGRPTDASERLKLARAQFPEAVEIIEVAKEVDAALADPDTTGSVSAVSHAVAEAHRLELAGRIREALVAWRGVRLLAPTDEDSKNGEMRTAACVAKAETLLTEGTELLHAGDPESAVARLTEANAVLPGDPLVEGRIKEASRLAADLKTELAAIEADIARGRAETAAPRLSALAERYPKARNVLEALSRAESAGREANRGAVRDRLAKALAAAKSHESAKRLRDAAQSWREAATLDPDLADAQEGVSRVERMLAEFDAMLGQARNLLSSGDPEGAERAATEALAVIAGDPAGEAQLARARTGVETLRHEAERIRTALAGEADDDVLSWARELSASYSGSALAADVLRETETKFKEAEEKATEKRVSGQLDRAKKLESEGNLAQALKAYQDVLRVTPDLPEAKASAARITGQFERARSRGAEAKALLEAGDPDGARAAAEESLGLLADQREIAGTLAGARAALAEIERAAQSFATVAAADRAEQQLDRLKRLSSKYPKSAQCADLVAKATAALAEAKRHAQRAQVRAHADQARQALAEGRLADAERACAEALSIDPADAAAKQTLEAARGRAARAKSLLAEGNAAAGAQRHAEARDKFAAALEADPHCADATKGRDAAVAAIAKSAAELAQAIEKATSLAKAGTPPEAIRAWERVAALDAGNAQAPAEIARLKTRLEKATADTARGRSLLNAGDPETAVQPLEAARAVMGPGEADALLSTAREQSAEIAKAVRQIESSLAAGEGALDEAEKTATALSAKFAGSARARDVAKHAASAAMERRRTLAVTQVRKLVREKRFGEARDLAASLRAEGVVSSELDAAAAQAEQAITKLDSLRTKATESRKAGRLVDARDALHELLVALPDDADVKAEVTEIDETIREVTARRDAADSARRRGAITQAIELFEEALALQGTDAEMEAEVVKLKTEAKDRTKLLDACHKAVKRGDGKMCAESAKQLLDRYPEDDDARDLHTTGECMEKMVVALLARAQRLAATGDRAAAAETAECLLRIAPGHVKAKALLKA
jgi:predicted Zn finger-like uncharacterized protein